MKHHSVYGVYGPPLHAFIYINEYINIFSVYKYLI